MNLKMNDYKEIIIWSNKNKVLFDNEVNNYLNYEIIIDDNGETNRIKNLEKNHIDLKKVIRSVESCKLLSSLYFMKKDVYKCSWGGNFFSYNKDVNNLVKTYIRLFYEFSIYRGDRFFLLLKERLKSYELGFVIKKIRMIVDKLMKDKVLSFFGNQDINYFQNNIKKVKSIIEDNLVSELSSVYGVQISILDVIIEN